ncbi:uncharacterized protein M6D78_014623 isoform 2-T2 [Vipera latastei]
MTVPPGSKAGFAVHVQRTFRGCRSPDWCSLCRPAGGSMGKSFSPSSSLNSSEEDLCAGVASSETPDSTAKLGDTHKLEAFIADLDQILKEI